MELRNEFFSSVSVQGYPVSNAEVALVFWIIHWFIARKKTSHSPIVLVSKGVHDSNSVNLVVLQSQQQAVLAERPLYVLIKTLVAPHEATPATILPVRIDEVYD